MSKAKMIADGLPQGDQASLGAATLAQRGSVGAFVS